MDASNLLKPMLASGQIKCIGSTTYQEYRGIFEKDRGPCHAASRKWRSWNPLSTRPSRFSVDSKLRSRKPRGPVYRTIATHGGELSSRYITDRQLPDKAIDVIDEAGARTRLLPAGKRRKTVGVQDIEAVISKMARIPPKTVTASDKDVLLNLDADLKRVVFGQDEAIAALVSAIKLARSGWAVWTGRSPHSCSPGLPESEDRSHTPAGNDAGN
ncbi:MAG: hypothetical protein Ct9H300mP16_08530 [Pseudomonadota bacterium]|nr:MAG: hypothetical protein Ct9H300mP16_08530 [Pseudomonadota bacterium]